MDPFEFGELGCFEPLQHSVAIFLLPIPPTFRPTAPLPHRQPSLLATGRLAPQLFGVGVPVCLVLESDGLQRGAAGARRAET